MQILALEKNQPVGKFLTRFTRFFFKSEKTQIINIVNERRDITTYPTDNERVIGELPSATPCTEL